MQLYLLQPLHLGPQLTRRPPLFCRLLRRPLQQQQLRRLQLLVGQLATLRLPVRLLQGRQVWWQVGTRLLLPRRHQPGCAPLLRSALCATPSLP